ncbi:hypothetical protein HYH03_009900 [Edaphochlamys debaryana]|uniref:Uncharacterized protein n=1 Tax=Edaphochlamys debaryana TaxID=47281 RepID=A0A835XY30_9CHLO|nr:hypothetical protein HYH03_009900 [Edaphochlamys debaryana]|eukprot:KAG2491737.1 hypothetical protein HYH03_009900 [Edaphochlamys debaryana]
MVKPEPAQSVVVPKMVVDTSKGGPPQFRLTKLFIDAYQTCPAAATKKCVPATTCGIYSGSKSDKLDCGLLYSPSGLLRFGPDPVSQNLVLAKINPENGNGEWLWDDWANRRDDFTRDTFNLTNLNPYTKTSVFLTSNGKLVHYDVEHGQPITDSFNNRFRHENPLKGTTIIQNTGVENGPFTLTLNDKLGAAFIKNKYGKTAWYCGCKPGQVSAITYDPSDNVGNRCFDIAKETALLTSHLDQTGSSSFLALGLPEGVTQKEGMFITQEPYTHSYRNLKWTVTQEAPGVPDKNDIWIWTVGSSEYNSMMLFHRIRSVANPTL